MNPKTTSTGWKKEGFSFNSALIAPNFSLLKPISPQYFGLNLMGDMQKYPKSENNSILQGLFATQPKNLILAGHRHILGGGCWTKQ